MANRIFNVLCEHPYGQTIYELCSLVYPSADGGPDYAISSIQTRIVRMNKKWKAENNSLRIHGHGGPGSRYQVWIVR